MFARILVALLAALAAVAGLPLAGSVAEATPIASDDRVIEVTSVLSANTQEVALSRDGRYVAYVLEQALQEVYLFDIETRVTTHVSKNILSDSGYISFSPDSTRLIFSEGQVQISPQPGQRSYVHAYEMATSTMTNLTEPSGTDLLNGRLAADNNMLVAQLYRPYQHPTLGTIPTSHIVLWNVAAGTFVDITPNGDNDSWLPQISDDGSVISFLTQASNITPEPKANDRESAQPILYFVNSGTYRSVSPGTTGDVARAHLTPKGDQLVFSSSDKTLDPRVTPAGQFGDQYHYDIAKNLTTRITYDPTNGGTLDALSPTGRWLPIKRSGNITERQTGLNIVDRKTGEEINLSDYADVFDERWEFTEAAISRNGATVALRANNSITVYRRPKCKGRFATMDLAVPDSDFTGRQIFGHDTDDRIAGTDGDDVIDGGDGNDIICGFGGNDRLRGGAGDDLLIGKAGRDRLWGGPGNDTLDGDVGTDKLYGGAGIDTLRGSKGPDLLSGGPGKDNCRGGAGDDTLVSC